MRRWLIFLLAVLFLTACHAENESELSFALYFPKPSEANFAAKTVEINVQEVSLSEIIGCYCDEEPPKGAEPAIPREWQFLDAQYEDGAAIVKFEGTSTSAIETNTAAACLLQTLLQLPEVDSLQLSAPGVEMMQLEREDLLLTDSGMLPQKESIVLYVPDEEGRFLLKQTQTVEAVEANDKPSYVLGRLFETAVSCIPHGTRLLDISVEQEICTVDLSSEFLRGMEPEFHCERMAVYAVVNSLTELPEVKTVEFLVEGAPLEELKYMKLPKAIGRDESLIAPTQEQWLDVTLYASCDGTALVRHPVPTAAQEGKSVEETVLDTLLSFTEADGAKNPIPEGTKRLSVLLEGNACIVDLTGEFLSGCEDAGQEMLAVQSVIATMSELEGVSSVEILVEGLEPNYRVAWLKNLRQPQKEWFAEG